MTRDFSELKERFYHYSESLISTPLVKLLGAETAILFQAATDMKADFLLIFTLNLVDLITAIIAAAKNDNVCSWGLRQSVLKLSIYILLIYLGHLTHLIAGLDWAQSAFMGLIVSTEIVSILENIELVNPGMLPRKLLNKFGITLKKVKKR